jgi:hypothetical protein
MEGCEQAMVDATEETAKSILTTFFSGIGEED